MPTDVTIDSATDLNYHFDNNGTGPDTFTVRYATTDLLVATTSKELVLAGEATITKSGGAVVFDARNSQGTVAFDFLVGNTSRLSIERTTNNGPVRGIVAVPLATSLPAEPAYDGQICVHVDQTNDVYTLYVGARDAQNALKWFVKTETPRP
jgi:hypothetical protein